jgi:hypothetical protein
VNAARVNELLRFLCLAVALVLLGCDSRKNVTGQIKRLQVSDSQGMLLFHVIVDGSERRLIVQGIDGQWIRTYFDAIQQSGGWISDLDLWIDSYHHTYSNGDVAYDAVQIFTSTPKDSGNAPRIVPGIDASSMPLGSCRFMPQGEFPFRLRDGSTPAREVAVGYGKFRFTTSTGSHAGKIPHKSPP